MSDQEETDATETAAEEQGMLGRAGRGLFSALIWDNNDPLWLNLTKAPLTAGAAILAIPSGGTSVAALAGAHALRAGGTAALRATTARTAAAVTTRTTATEAFKSAATSTAAVAGNAASVAAGTAYQAGKWGLSTASGFLSRATPRWVGLGLASPIIASVADNATGNHASTALGRAAADDRWYQPAASAALNTMNWGLRAWNTIVTALPGSGAAATIGALEQRGVLDPASDDYEIKTKIINASAHGLAGNAFEVARVLGGTDLQAAHVVEAYQHASQQSDDPIEQGQIVLDLLAERIAEADPIVRRARREQEQQDAEMAAETSREHTGLAALATTDIDRLNGPNLTQAFESATEIIGDSDLNMGQRFMFNLLSGAVSFLQNFNFFGIADGAIEFVQRQFLEMAKNEVINQGENLFGASDTLAHAATGTRGPAIRPDQQPAPV